MSSETTITRREALKRGVTLGGAALVWVTPATSAFAMSSTVAQAASGANQGCTPGFWKNNTGAWVGYEPSTTIGSAFGFSSACADVQALLGKTLLQGLNFGGGSGIAGKAQILLRAAIASLLNSAHPNVDASFLSNVKSEVAAVLSGSCAELSEDRIVGLASVLDNANNAGCPLSAAR